MQILHMKKDVIVRQVSAEFPQFEVTTIHMHLETERTPAKDTEDKNLPASDTDYTRLSRSGTNTESSGEIPENGSSSKGRLGELLGRLGEQVEKRNNES
jgi:hypothetical protein